MLSKREEKQRGKSVHRLVTKDGKQRIKVNLGCRLRNRKVMDFFTSVVDYNWCFLAIFITLGYFTCWLLFATLWSLLYYVHDYLSSTNDEGRFQLYPSSDLSLGILQNQSVFKGWTILAPVFCLVWNFNKPSVTGPGFPVTNVQRPSSSKVSKLSSGCCWMLLSLVSSSPRLPDLLPEH